MSSDAPSKLIKEVKKSSMVKLIKKRTTTRKMPPTAALFTLPKNAVTKQMCVSSVEKLKQIYEAEGNAALVWGGNGKQAVSYKDIIVVLSRTKLSSTISIMTQKH